MNGTPQRQVEPSGESLITGQRWGRERLGPEHPPHVFRAEDPTTGRAMEPECVCAAPAWVAAAASAGARAFESYRASGGDVRASLLERIAVELEAVQGPLIRRAVAETGLAQARLEMEFDRTVRTLRMFAGVIRGESWGRPAVEPPTPGATPGSIPAHGLRRVSVPIGPVAVFGASNFPLAYGVAGGDTASALAAGCPVIVKGHPSHPGTGEIAANAVARSIKECGLDPGIFSYLHSGGEQEMEVGAALVAHPAIRGVGFTGSYGGGMALARSAAARREPIPVFAEMGSANPVYLLPGAVKERGGAIAEELAASILSSSGQQCTCPGILFILGDEAGSAFAQTLAGVLDAAATNVMLSRRVQGGYHARVKKCLETTAVSCTPRLRGFAGSPPASDGPVVAPAGLLRADFETLKHTETLRDEIFGPAALLVSCTNLEELVEAPFHVHGSLATAVYASGRDDAADLLVNRLIEKAGRVVWNGVTTGVRVAQPMVHGGPFPATNRPDTTAVGPDAIQRWTRPVCFQNLPTDVLPIALRRA